MGGRDGVYGEKTKNSLTPYKDSIMSPPSALMGLPHREEVGHRPAQDLRTTNNLCFQGMGQCMPLTWSSSCRLVSGAVKTQGRLCVLHHIALKHKTKELKKKKKKF